MHKTTVDKVGVKEVKLKCSGGDKKMVTCMLLAASNGRKARPTVVFKGKGKSKQDKVLVTRTDVQLGLHQLLQKTRILPDFPRKLFSLIRIYR